MEPTKPSKCTRPPASEAFPKPRGVELKTPIDTLEQGQAYGDGWSRGKIAYEADVKINKTLWDACDKQHAADEEKYISDLAAVARAANKLKELGE